MTTQVDNTHKHTPRPLTLKGSETGRTHTHITPPKAGTKQAWLVKRLSRKSGVTLTEASKTLGWQAHTLRATFTRLKARGYQIVRQDRKDKESVYVIVTPEGA